MSEYIRYISLNLGPIAGVDDTVTGIRVVPTKEAGRVVYGRTLNVGESAHDAEGIRVDPGRTIIFPPGSIKITIRDTDRYAKFGPDGYAPVTNTVWSWINIPPQTFDQESHYYLLSTARRLDVAHAQCVQTLVRLRESSQQSSFLKKRTFLFNSLGHAESMCIALNRAIRMICQAKSRIFVKAEIPADVSLISNKVKSFRDAIEHIDDRAFGEARREAPTDAMSIFDQTKFFLSGVLTYAGLSLNIGKEIVPAMVAARQFVLDAVTVAGSTKTINTEIKWTIPERTQMQPPPSGT